MDNRDYQIYMRGYQSAMSSIREILGDVADMLVNTPEGTKIIREFIMEGKEPKILPYSAPWVINQITEKIEDLELEQSNDI